LLVSTVVLIVLTIAVPYLPFAAVFGFVPLSGMLLVAIGGIAALYVVSAELLKKWFYRPLSHSVEATAGFPARG
jgi:Mg2+-importing ATPase